MAFGLVAATAVAATLLAGMAMPAAAVEPIIGQPIPDEPVGVGFPEIPATGGLVMDIDGDGVAELLAITGSPDALGLASIATYWVGPGGVEGDSAVPLRRAASVDELLSGRGRLGIDADDMIAVRLDEPAHMIVVQRDGAAVPLVAAIGTNPEFDVPCCLTIWEVGVDGGEVELRLVASTQRQATELVPADMDADGTDELLVLEDTDEDGTTIGLLRWNGTRYVRTAITLPVPNADSCCGYLADAGDTDGVPGDEVLVASPFGDGPAGLHRVSWRNEQAHVESADMGYLTSGRAVQLTIGPAILATNELSTLTLWEWPRDEEALQVTFRAIGGQPAALFGQGAEALAFVTAGSPPGSLVVIPADLGQVGGGPTESVGRDTRGGGFRATVQLAGSGAFDDEPMAPFFGIFPGGIPGDPDAYVFSGKVVTPAGGAPGSLAAVRDTGLMMGREPLGRVGPDGSWTALLTNFHEFQSFDGLGRGPEVVVMAAVREPGQLVLADTDTVLTPEVGMANLYPTFHGVAPDPERAMVLMVGREAADAVVAAPQGSRVWWSTRGGIDSVVIGPEGEARIRLLEPAGPDAPDGSGATASIWLVTPAGHAYAGTWRIRVFRQPPDLGITDRAPFFDLAPTLSGRTIPGATVTINGNAIPVADDGSFSTPVEVGIVPTELRVVVTDPVGNETVRVVSRVWPLDYRQLPFVPIAVLLTIIAAVILYLRRPESGPPRARVDDGASFEEISG